MTRSTWPKRILSGGLTLGASLVLGLLSFAGFYSIIPILPLSLASFALATMYEGEIYHQNIFHALEKLFNKDYFRQERANALLQKMAIEDTQHTLYNHQFFREYRELHAFIEAMHLKKKLDASQKEALAKARRRMALMQRYFKKILFSTPSTQDEYGFALKEALNINLSEEKHPDFIVQDTERKLKFMRWGLALSVLAGFFVGVGTAGLLIESFSTIAFLTLSSAALPYVVVPLAALAAAGYFYLTYNSVTDMIWNDTLQKWWQEVKHDIKTSSPRKAITLTIVSALLIVMSTTLALCTAGTWWTVVKSNPKLLSLLTRVPHIVTAVLVTVFGGISQLIFGLENIKETLDTFKGLFNNFYFRFIGKYIAINSLRLVLRIAIAWENESKWQFFNPFRALLKVIETPLRLLGFAGHIGSIGVTADRVPKVNPFITLILNMIEEVAEDAHYFMPKSQLSEPTLPNRPTTFMHRLAAKILTLKENAKISVHGESACEGHHHHDEDDHEHHGHTHSDNDLPTRIIRFGLSPIYALSILWHKVSSHFTDNPISLKQAYCEQYGIHQDNTHDIGLFLINAPAILWRKISSRNTGEAVSWRDAYEEQYEIHHADHDEPFPVSPKIDSDFQKAATLMQIEEQVAAYHSSDRYKERKANAFDNLYQQVSDMKADSLNQDTFQATYEKPSQVEWGKLSYPISQILAQHRHKLHHGKTRSEQFICELKENLTAVP